MKSIMLSIQPKWCEKIASGEKTIEVRKTRPKLETPFKFFIYCTYGTLLYADYRRNSKDELIREIKLGTFKVTGKNHIGNQLNGKVIGEFICDKITEYECSSDGHTELATTSGSCLTYDEILNYCNGYELYGWHISDLKIYDTPRELGEFICRKPLRRPPQSWCYVEERIWRYE